MYLDFYDLFHETWDKVQSVLGCTVLRASLGSASQNLMSAWDHTAALVECQ